MTGIVTNLQRFSVQDGAGVRTTVFLKGCPLSCQWCHNPETKSRQPQIQVNFLHCLKCGGCVTVCPKNCHTILPQRHEFDSTACIRCFRCVKICPAAALEVCGTEMTVEEVMEEVCRDRAFYGKKGGLTLSGGEPMAQPEFALALLKQAKKEGFTAGIETCGMFPSSYLKPLSECCDFIYYDCKEMDTVKHKAYTDADNFLILENLKKLAFLFPPEQIYVRTVLIKGWTDTKEHVGAICRFLKECKIKNLELLAFHPYGSSKKEAIGNRTVSLGKEAIPDEMVLEELRKYGSEEL